MRDLKNFDRIKKSHRTFPRTWFRAHVIVADEYGEKICEGYEGVISPRGMGLIANHRVTIKGRLVWVDVESDGKLASFCTRARVVSCSSPQATTQGMITVGLQFKDLSYRTFFSILDYIGNTSRAHYASICKVLKI